MNGPEWEIKALRMELRDLRTERREISQYLWDNRGSSNASSALIGANKQHRLAEIEERVIIIIMRLSTIEPTEAK